MSIDAIGQVVGADASPRQSQVNLDDFLDIFLTQLTYQDPLEPVDNREFIAQLAEFSNLQIANSTGENIDDLLQVTAIDQSIGLVGRQVEISGANGNSMIGTVLTVRFQGGAPLLSGTTSDGVSFVDLSPAQISLVR